MRVVMAMSGASGMAYGIRLLQLLAQTPHETDLTLSPCAATVLQVEEGIEIDLSDFSIETLLGFPAKNIRYYRYDDFTAPMSSGSSRLDAMVVCPCSCGTLARIAHGISDDLATRAADVFLKERRPLILVTRETPLNLIQLRNMVAVTEAGALVLPASPSFYHHPVTRQDLIDTVVARVLDHLGIECDIVKRWGDIDTPGVHLSLYTKEPKRWPSGCSTNSSPILK